MKLSKFEQNLLKKKEKTNKVIDNGELTSELIIKALEVATTSLTINELIDRVPKPARSIMANISQLRKTGKIKVIGYLPIKVNRKNLTLIELVKEEE